MHDATFLESLLIIGGRNGVRPKLDEGPPWSYREIPFEDWWNQIILITSSLDRFTRKSLILNLANKDGGAHIDKNLDPDYERLKSGYWWQPQKVNNEYMSIKFENPHYLHVRQIAWEILNSPEIISILQ
ncbi:MAG: hypothetical protein ACTSYF_03660 [Promethearchaeota archaeon]